MLTVGRLCIGTCLGCEEDVWWKVGWNERCSEGDNQGDDVYLYHEPIAVAPREQQRSVPGVMEHRHPSFNPRCRYSASGESFFPLAPCTRPASCLCCLTCNLRRASRVRHFFAPLLYLVGLARLPLTSFSSHDFRLPGIWLFSCFIHADQQVTQRPSRHDAMPLPCHATPHSPRQTRQMTTEPQAERDRHLKPRGSCNSPTPLISRHSGTRLYDDHLICLHALQDSAYSGEESISNSTCICLLAGSVEKLLNTCFP